MQIDRRSMLALPLALAGGSLASCAADAPSITVYSTLPRKIAGGLIELFTRQTGLAVNVWRADRAELAKRVAIEVENGVVGFDVIELEASHLIGMIKKRAIFADLGADIRKFGGSPKLAISRTRSNCMGWNTNRLPQSSVPRRYEDLLKPELKNRIVLVGGAVPWFHGLHHAWGEEKATAFFDALARQGFVVSEGRSLTAQLLASGEFALCPAIFEYMIAGMKRSGDPVDYAFLDPLVIEQNAWAVHIDSKMHPQCEAFIRFCQGDGRKVLRDNQMVPGELPEFKRQYPSGIQQFVTSEGLNDVDVFKAWSDRYHDYLRKGLKL